VTRTLLTGGLVFDGTGAPPAEADVLVEGGRIVGGGPGWTATRPSTSAAATWGAAGLLGVGDELGTLEAGKRADLVVVDGDPFELATLGDRITAVIQDGRLVAGHVAAGDVSS
jgi:predicted amidohydrolase YtcJ